MKKTIQKIGFGLLGLNLFSTGFAQATEEITTNSSFLDPFLQSSWPVMSFVLGLFDGFNPCAMWTLFVLISFLLTVDSKLKRWAIGSVFIGTSGIIYLAAMSAYLAGFSAFSASIGPKITWLYLIVGLVAIFAGIVAIKGSKTAGIECEVRDASSRAKFSKKMKEVLSHSNIWFVFAGVIALAFTVNAVELVCSIYIPTAFVATLIMLDLSLLEKVIAVLIYDIAYILDDIVVFAIAMRTMSLIHFSPKIVQRAQFYGGILLILIGLAVVLDQQWFNIFENIFGVGFIEKMGLITNSITSFISQLFFDTNIEKH